MPWDPQPSAPSLPIVEPPSELDDDALVALWKQGKEQAFSTLVDRHGASVMSTLRGILGDQRLAEDAWSETFIRVVRARDQYVADGRFRAWLFTIARRCAKDEARTVRRWLRRAQRVFDEPRSARPEVGAPDLRVIESERSRQLDDALASLSEQHREIVLLTYVADLTSVEIAQTIGLTDQQVRSRLTYARRLLRQELEPQHATQ